MKKIHGYFLSHPVCGSVLWQPYQTNLSFQINNLRIVRTLTAQLWNLSPRRNASGYVLKLIAVVLIFWLFVTCFSMVMGVQAYPKDQKNRGHRMYTRSTITSQRERGGCTASSVSWKNTSQASETLGEAHWRRHGAGSGCEKQSPRIQCFPSFRGLAAPVSPLCPWFLFSILIF